MPATSAETSLGPCLRTGLVIDDASRRPSRQPGKTSPCRKIRSIMLQAPAAGDRERPFRCQKAHAADRRLSILLHGVADDPGVRSHAMAAKGLCGRLDGMRAESADVGLFRSTGDC